MGRYGRHELEGGGRQLPSVPNSGWRKCDIAARAITEVLICYAALVYDINQFILRVASMSSSAAESAVLESQRLRYVTENFKSLQGLRLVAIGLLFWFPSVAEDLPRWLFYISCLATFIVLSQIQKYYEERFGSVESKPKQLSTIGVIVSFLATIGFLASFAEYNHIQPIIHRIHIAIGDPNSKVDLLPLVACILVLWGRFRRSLWLWRSDLIFLTLSVLFYTSVVFAPLTHPHIADIAPWKFVVKYWASVLFITTGIYDHCLLVRFFPRRPVESQEI